jgi:chemotaxis protein CheX
MTTEQIVHAVQRATLEVFSTMLGVDIIPAQTHIAKTCPPINNEVMAFLGLSGPWVGSGVITCSADFACRLCALFLMSETPSLNEEVLDAIGELANMIIGNFKTAAEEVVGPLGLSVPTVIYGRNFVSKSVGSSNWIIMPFAYGNDTFEVRLWFACVADSGAGRVRLPQSQAA